MKTKSAIENIRDMARGYHERNMAQPSLLRDLVAAADEVEAQQSERDALRALIADYFTLVDDQELNMHRDVFYDRLFALEDRMRAALEARDEAH